MSRRRRQRARGCCCTPSPPTTSLRNAKQLRKVTMVGDEVDLEVDERWRELPRLLDRVRSVKGVRRISINGQANDYIDVRSA